MLKSRINLKAFFKYVSTVLSWTIISLLIIVGIFLIYYYISVKLYATFGNKYEPKFSVYTIVSESMHPTIKKFDVIVNTKINNIDDVKINDVITFISAWNVNYGMTITHRVVDTKLLDNNKKCLVTRGDNNTQTDPVCVEEANVIGVTKAVIPGLGKLQFFLASKMGWFIAILIPALCIIFKDILKIFKIIKPDKEIKEKKEKKENTVM